MTMDAFAGIDVAFRKGKFLPVALCVWDESGRFVPKRVRELGAPEPPRGAGNVAALDPVVTTRFADETAAYLRRLEKHFGVRIRRVAIDAPSDPPKDNLYRRKAEQALDAWHISCFATPNAAAWAEIRAKVCAHLRAGGTESRLPHANQLWMLIGFALFERLRRDWECLEVFPQAIASVLGANSTHKSQPGGVLAQLAAAARYTRWPDPPVESLLKTVAHGPSHDALDAYLAAWVAGLRLEERSALGVPPDDVIWIPSLTNAVQRAAAHDRRSVRERHCVRCNHKTSLFAGVKTIRRAGFAGFMPIRRLRETELRAVPGNPGDIGVYLVLRPVNDAPIFLRENPGGHFKGRDPTVPVEKLQSNWVTGSPVVYIGKAGAVGSSVTLRSRLGLYLKFGAGFPVGHWGGRLIWQLSNSDDLIVCWKKTRGKAPRGVEKEMIRAFVEAFGRRPFANLAS